MSHDHGRRRYLTAKHGVDERARDCRVRDRLCETLAEQSDRPHVIEAGPGAGLTVADLRSWGIDPASYRGVDADPRVVAFARHLLPRVLRRAGATVTETTTGCTVGDAGVEFAVGDALADLPEREADLLVAQSFLDLVPVGTTLDAFTRAVEPGGLVYAPLTFDGVTAFRPSHPADAAVVDAFHADIDASDGRESRAGRHALDALRRRDTRLLAVGSSDWIVRPVDGGYRGDERYFLKCILGFVAGALDGVVDGDSWLATRRRQLAAGELTYVAHNYDLLWQTPR